MLGTLDARLAQAHAGELGHLDFLQVLCQDEISRRETISLAKPDPRRARFEEQATLEGFDFGRLPQAARRPDPRPRRPALARTPASPSFSTGPSASARATSPRPWRTWPSAHGAETRFLKTSRILAHLAGGRADRTWDKRLRELTRPPSWILDDFAMRELTAAQADDLYELITERAGRSTDLDQQPGTRRLVPAVPQPVVAESLLDRLINTSHQVFMNGPSYRPEQTTRACRPHRDHERTANIKYGQDLGNYLITAPGELGERPQSGSITTCASTYGRSLGSGGRQSGSDPPPCSYRHRRRMSKCDTFTQELLITASWLMVSR